MKQNDVKIDEIALALIYISSFQDGRVWKGYDWDILHRLHEKGLITDPVGKTKSFYLTEDGLKLGEKLALNLSMISENK